LHTIFLLSIVKNELLTVGLFASSAATINLSSVNNVSRILPSKYHPHWFYCLIVPFSKKHKTPNQKQMSIDLNCNSIYAIDVRIMHQEDLRQYASFHDPVSQYGCMDLEDDCSIECDFDTTIMKTTIMMRMRISTSIINCSIYLVRWTNQLNLHSSLGLHNSIQSPGRVSQP
jgi:hypothetical protein